jgi:lysophospholipase L1-like esterase
LQQRTVAKQMKAQILRFKNNALYDEDNFHPNNLGYQLMATAIQEKIVETKDLWLIKESN